MKGKIFFGSMLAVLLLVLVPTTGAMQIQTVEKETSLSLLTAQTMKTMTPEALRTFLQTLVKNDPVASDELQSQMNEMDTTTIATLTKTSSNTMQGAQSTNDSNQTVLEKIFWKIYNYRLLRFYVSILIYAVHPTKLTTLRVLTWGIKVLRITELGVLLGFIPSNPQPPVQIEITFSQDLANKTLTVTSVSPATVLWSDIDQIGSGHCDPLPTGTVVAGDQLTNCTGFIILRYIPSDIILGYFEFT